MKYLLKVLLIMTLILLSLKLVIHIFDKGHTTKYSLGNFNVKETLTVKGLYSEDNYYYEIKHEDFKINFQINQNYNKAEKVLTDIKYLDNGVAKCILPIFKNKKIITDIMCLEDSIITTANTTDSKVETFKKSLKKYGYNEKQFKDTATPKKLSNNIEIYEDNLNSDHYLAMETYKGLNLLNDGENVKLFNNDVYKKQISAFTDKYYIVADYNQEYSFKIFYAVNIINGNIKEIRSYNEISFDSIIQGVVDGEIYLFDKDAETQYKINIEDESVNKIEGKIKYYNGKWTTMTLSEALSGKTFNNNATTDIKGYDRVDKIGKKQGYYYMYKQNGDKYSVYRADIQNPKIKTYLFDTTDLNSIIYQNDYIYFKNGTSLYYHYKNGIRKVVQNKELEFNKDISFGAYSK